MANKIAGEDSLVDLSVEEIRTMAMQNSENKGLLAYYFTIFSKGKPMSRDEIVSKLQCSLHEYYETALCKTPPVIDNYLSTTKILEISFTTRADYRALLEITKEAMKMDGVLLTNK